MGWVTRKEYCEREGVKTRAFQYRKKAGLIQWRFGSSGRGGEAGKHIEVWIDDSKDSSESGVRSSEKVPNPKLKRISSKWQPVLGTMKIARGEPGCGIVTPIENGVPIDDGRCTMDDEQKAGYSVISNSTHVDRTTMQTGCRQGQAMSDPTIRANRVCDPLPPEQGDGLAPLERKALTGRAPLEDLPLTGRECGASTGLTPATIESRENHPGDPLGQCAPATQRNLPERIEAGGPTKSQTLEEVAGLPQPSVASSGPALNPNLSTIYNDTKIIPASCQRIANFRYALIQKFNEELTKEDPNLPLFKNGNGKPSKTKIIEKFLELYNSDLILPEIHKTLKSVKRSTLYDWLHIYNDGGIDGLVPQYGGPKKSNILPGEKDYLLKFLLRQNKPKISDGIRECKRYLGEYSTSGPSTLRQFIDEFKTQYHDVWTLRREGEKAWNDKDAPYQDRNPMLLEVGEVIVADGHQLNLNVIDPLTGKKRRAVLVLFWDWKSTYPLGWEITFSENTQCIATALRNALLALGKIPSNIYIDNGKAFLAKIFTRKIIIEETEIPGMIARLGSQYRRAMPYHGQSKPIERFFRIINDRLERRMDSYIGASVTDKPAYLLRNEKLAQQLHNDRTPTIEDVFNVMLQWREEYIDEPLPKRQGLTARQMYTEGKGAGLDPKALCFLMMAIEVKSVRRNRFTFAGIDWTGDCLYGYHGKVIIRYSLSDFSKIYVFGTDDRLMGVVTQSSDAHPIKDWQAAKRIIAERRRDKKESKKLAAFIDTKRFVIEGRRDPHLIDYIETEEAKRPENRILLPHFDDEIEPSTPVASDEPGEPHFNDAWERYEFLLKKPEITDEEKIWINDYETGNIFPGEWVSNYGNKVAEGR